MRHANRVLAALLSLALIAAGVLLIIEVIADRVSHRPSVVDWHPAYDWAKRTTWNAGSIRVACAVLILLGLVLLIAELKPARVSRLAADPAQAGAAGIDTAYTRRGLAAAIRSAVTGVDGVRNASVKVKRRKVTIAATAAAQDKAAARSLRDPIPAAARQRLTALKLRRDALGLGASHPQEPLMHADRTNRIMLLLLALLLIAAGAGRRRRIHRGVRDRHPAQPPDRQPDRALHRRPGRLALARRRRGRGDRRAARVALAACAAVLHRPLR